MDKNDREARSGRVASAARPDRFRITPTAVTAATHSKLATMTIAPMSL
jgi:hypothetical protein